MSATNLKEVDVKLEEKMISNKESVKQIIEDELERKGSGGVWAMTIFLLCLTPNIFNGFHVNSYVFLSTPPANYYCVVPELTAVGWTDDEIRNISTKGGTRVNNTCNLLNYDYKNLSTMNYNQALDYIQEIPVPEEVSCLSRKDVKFFYDQAEGLSIVPEWDLICENTVWRSTVQMFLSFGKFFGATLFGFISDKYGRKIAFTMGSICYITGSVLVTASPTYLVLLAGRLFLGLASSGVFYAAFTLLTENVGAKARSWMSVSFNFSYPIGMVILAITAYFVRPWRMLSLALTVPSFLLFLHIFFLVESPRWLLSKGNEKRAYKMVFGSKMPKNLKIQLQEEQLKSPPESPRKKSIEAVTVGERLKKTFSMLHSLYGPSTLRKRAFICHFTWCVTSLCYYVTALNANIGSSRYIYVAATGSVDIIGYISLIVILRYVGRRNACSALFLLAGSALLSVLFIPADQSAIITTMAMIGRYGITSVYAVMTLHTAEMFPTEIRNSALGISSTCAHIGGILAPYVVDLLGKIKWFIPSTICGVSVLIACLLVLLQPETKDKHLTDHVEDEEESMEKKSENVEMKTT